MANCNTCLHSEGFQAYTICTHETHKNAILIGEHQCPMYQPNENEEEPPETEF